jgi:beta-N-acetylhexosaminidase
MFSKMVGNIIAYELGILNIDLSFTPVLDLDYGKSKVISDRSFHHSHEVVSTLSLELIKGLDQMGFKNVAKHFPGHGFVQADSHTDLPIDNRKIDKNLTDLKPYIKNINEIDAVMTAHIIYKSVDANPVCYSDYWINSILRKSLNFKGLIISDDLLMKGADIGKSVFQRVIDCLESGCDLALVCNFYDEIPNLLNELEKNKLKIFQNSRIHKLRKSKVFTDNEKKVYEIAKFNIESNFD